MTLNYEMFECAVRNFGGHVHDLKTVLADFEISVQQHRRNAEALIRMQAMAAENARAFILNEMPPRDYQDFMSLIETL